MTPEQEQLVRERAERPLVWGEGEVPRPVAEYVWDAAHDRRALLSDLDATRAELDDCRRRRWHHNPDAPPEHFCADCDAARADLASMVATANAVAGQRDAARAERDALVGGIEVEWYNGNIDETARDRLIGIYGDIPEANITAYRSRSRA